MLVYCGTLLLVKILFNTNLECSTLYHSVMLQIHASHPHTWILYVTGVCACFETFFENEFVSVLAVCCIKCFVSGLLYNLYTFLAIMLT